MIHIKAQLTTDTGRSSGKVHYAYQTPSGYFAACLSRSRTPLARVEENTPITCQRCEKRHTGRGPKSLRVLLEL